MNSQFQISEKYKNRTLNTLMKFICNLRLRTKVRTYRDIFI